ncbi:MAG: hypothetical protein JSV50_09755 [Desulfobacteraceae bacterium]|nr:MAG: hypothetical protein JSV50_09755 [Desulfobacteraceae bacterium]
MPSVSSLKSLNRQERSWDTEHKDELLARAEAHIFSTGLRDGATHLCRANMKYGLAKIHWVQEQLGTKSDTTFISTPDMTITRNVARWKSGFGYGGKVTWGDGDIELVILDVKPNTCGMLVGGIERLPDSSELVRMVDKLKGGKREIDGIEVQWDFHLSNHFIDLFWVKPLGEVKFSEYVFIIHSSARELTGDNRIGFGLYYDKSPLLRNMAERFNTPFGPLHILTGSRAREYYQFYRFAEEYSKQKRNIAAEALFGEFKLIANEVHQGLANMNEILLGCHQFDEKEPDCVFPFVLRADLPAYLVKGKPNLEENDIESLGFRQRSQRLGVYDRLKKANIIPHGSGYAFPDLLNVSRVFEHNAHRYFEVDLLNDRGKKVLSDVREIPYIYRGREVVLKTLELNMCELVAKLLPQYVLKI